MNILKLKNGSEEPEPLVVTTMMTLEHLMSGFPGVLMASDLAQICREDPNYSKFGDNEEQLQRLALLQGDGKPHNSVRNIVLSAFVGEGLELRLVSPVAA
jgi:hypothetical protein